MNIYKSLSTSKCMEKKSFKVTPWEVEGKIDYNKLIKEFGTQEISPALLKRVEKHAKELHLMLRRGVFFSHRDFDFILNEYEKGKKFFLYTGRGPSGKVHIGHLLPWILCKWFQDKFNVNMYFQLTDDEKFYTKKNLSLEDTKKLAYENALDFIALGFSPEKTKIIIDTKDIALLYPLAAEVAKKLTFSTAKAVFGFTNETNVGLIFYTSLQSAPCFLEDKPCLIPLGIDQDPHFRITRDIAPKLKKYKPSLLHNMMLPPLQGIGGKMSASAGETAVYTTDSPKEVEHKIKKYAFSGGKDTIEEHRKKGGDPDIDVSFQYLRMFFEPDDKKLEKIYNDYKSGKMLTSELKNITIDKINAFLAEHQKKREAARKELNKFLIKF